MLLKNLIYILQDSKDILLLEDTLFASGLKEFPLDYVVLASIIKEGINLPLLVPVYVSANHFIIEINPDNSYKTFKFQNDALQHVRSSLQIDYIPVEDLELSESRDDFTIIYSINKQVSIKDLKIHYNAYERSIDKQLESLLENSKPVIHNSIFKTIKNYFIRPNVYGQ